MCVIEHVCPRGVAAPLHLHRREAEWFFVVDGHVTFTVGDEVISAGAFAYGPPQVPHTFVVDGDEGARFLLVAQPAGLEGFIRELSVPATSLTLPPASVAMPSPPEMMAVATKYGIEILGPPPGLDG